VMLTYYVAQLLIAASVFSITEKPTNKSISTNKRK